MESLKARSPLIPFVIAAGVLVVLLGAVFVWHASQGSAPGPDPHGSLLSRIGSSHAASLPACVPATTHAPVAPLKLAESRARQLTSEQRFSEAMALYQDIETSDPTFPGLSLDRSVVLLQSGQMEKADQAIENQIATSKCLTALSPEHMQTYCSAELPGLTLPACQQQVTGMLRTAHLQSALVQMQLGRGPSAPMNAPAAAEIPMQSPVESTPPAASSPAAPRTVAPRTAESRQTEPRAMAQRPASTPAARPATNRKQSLTTGADTDAAFGAYSR